MHVLIAHPSCVVTTRLRGLLTKNPAIILLHCVASLTETYDYAEHQAPDFVFVSAALADCPEFEVLSSLLRIMGIGCVLLGQTPPLGVRKQTGAQGNPLVHLAENPTDAEIRVVLETFVRYSPHKPVQSRIIKTQSHFDPERVILIGASTGGIDALLRITRHFSEDCPPTLIVQHTGGSFAKSLIRLLNGATRARVEEAQDSAPLQPGHIYLAPGDQSHLCLSGRRSQHLTLKAADLITGHRPSIDALFSSARPIATKVAAALLTGMGRDGARGLTELRQAGAYTIGQDEATSVVYGMPRIALELGGVCDQLPVDQIGPALLRASTMRARA